MSRQVGRSREAAGHPSRLEAVERIPVVVDSLRAEEADNLPVVVADSLRAETADNRVGAVALLAAVGHRTRSDPVVPRVPGIPTSCHNLIDG